MSYQVIWSERSRKNLELLGKSIASRIITKVEGISEDPFTYVKRLQGVSLFSLRVGEYRVILDIENTKMVIFVVKLGHRSRIYDGP
jgi:mRNA interferase RelE/StbE